MSQFPPIINQSGPAPGGSFGPAPRTSVVSIFSMLTGIFAPFLFCCFLLSLPLSFTAIICGHIGYSQIRRQPDVYTGLPMAIVGLIGGYLGLFVTIGFFVIGALAPKDNTGSLADSPAKKAMSRIELLINTDNKGIAHGNSEEAKAVAEAFAKKMKELDEEFFTQTDATFKLSGGNYVTYCQLNEDSCVFVVHVPEYRRFEDDAKEALAELAWAAAHGAAAEELEIGDQIAVGMKGVFLFGAVMVGEFGNEEPTTHTDDKEDLYPLLNTNGNSIRVAPADGGIDVESEIETETGRQPAPAVPSES